MNLTYYYCSSCGFEGFDIFCAFSRSVANGDLYLCPECGKEHFADEGLE